MARRRRLAGLLASALLLTASVTPFLVPRTALTRSPGVQRCALVETAQETQMELLPKSHLAGSQCSGEWDWVSFI
eukprot:s136_g19.t1